VVLLNFVLWGIILRWRTRIQGPVLAGTGRVTKVELLRPSYDQRDWYHVTVQLTIPEMPDRTVDAPPHRFEFEPNDRPVVGDIWSVEVSATDPSRYRLLDFPVRRDLSSATAKPLTHPSWVIKPIIKPPTLQAYTGGPGLDSRFGQREVRGPVLTGTAQALIVQRITEPGGEWPDRYHYVITLRVKTPRYEPYDVIRMYRNMKKIRPFEGDAWEVQVSESDPFTLAVLFERPLPTQP
jgi:hypothetical protein